MKRTVFLITDITGGGGTERTTILLANTFAGKGHKTTIYSLFKSNVSIPYIVDKNVSVVFLTSKRYHKETNFLKKFFLIVGVLFQLKKHLKLTNNDVIIGQNFLCNTLLWLSGKAAKSIACEHFKYHLYRTCVLNFRNYIYRRFLKVVVLTDTDAKEFKKNGISANVVENMLSFPPMQVERSLQKRIISAGRLCPEKGYDILLDAVRPVFDKFPNWRLDIFGDGPDRAKLEAKMVKLNLQENVSFKGFTSDIHSEYLNSDFYVMSSRFEGFPMTLLEALACSLPIVSFDCSEGPATLLKEGAGILVPKENASKLSQACIFMIENQQYRDTCSQNSYKTALLYTPEVIYTKWTNLIENK